MDKKRTLFLSHRGESDDAPENTLSAFDLAIQRNSDGIELDVRMCADKHIVCVHDATLQRVAGVPLAVAENTLSGLRQFHPVPLLSEVLAILTVGMMLQVELKGAAEQIAQVREILDDFPEKHSQICISSFEEETILKAADAFPELPRVLLVDLEKLFGTFPAASAVIGYLTPLKCGVSFKADFRADAGFVQELKNAGLRVVCWGVFSDELGLHMAEAGVDALTCNHAVALRQKYFDAASQRQF